MTTMRTLRVALVAGALTLLASCGGGPGGVPDAASPDPAPAVEPAPSSAAPTAVPASAPGVLVARADGPVDVYASPSAPVPERTLAATTEFGSPRVLAVTERADGWLRVELPERPNGSSGWVREEDVELRRVDEELHIDLAARTLELRVAGDVVVRTPVAIGAADAPTPTGRFYVVDLLDTGGSGAYGPYALGLSVHSEVLTEFAGGDGQIGVHGTDDPTSIGAAVSHGCVRVPNDVVTRLAELVPLGTPVTIV